MNVPTTDQFHMMVRVLLSPVKLRDEKGYEWKPTGFPLGGGVTLSCLKRGVGRRIMVGQSMLFHTLDGLELIKESGDAQADAE